MIWRLRVAVIAAGVLALVLLGVALVALVFPLVGEARRQRIIVRWSRMLLAWCRVRLVVRGPSAEANDPQTTRAAMRLGGVGALLVMNHVSWLDIYVVHSLRATHFVAKAEIARWPVIGFLVRHSGTVFLERGRRHAVRDANQRMATLLEAGELVGMFPEGTVSDGHRLLPFHANLVQPAIHVGAPVVVAGVRYVGADGRPTDATLYTEGITLFGSLVRIARHGALTAELHLVDAIDTTAMGRHDVARKAHALVARALSLDDDAVGDRALDDLASMAIAQDIDVVAATDPARSPGDRAPGTALDPRDELL